MIQEYIQHIPTETIIWLQILTTAITIIWFETFGVGQRLKVLLGWKPMDYVKPFDCRYCTHFWIGTIISIATLNPELIITNIVISNVYEKINNV